MNLLECLGECLGETVCEHANPDKVWRSLSLAERRNLAAEHAQSQQRRMILSENRGAWVSFDFKAWNPVSIGRKVVRVDSGVFILPASAFEDPAKPDSKTVLVMESFLGGTQLHLERTGSVTYALPDFLPEGLYHVTARVVTIHRKQAPLVFEVEPTGNCAKVSVSMDIPYTGGKWSTTTEPLAMTLNPGAKLHISRNSECHGLTIKDFVSEQRLGMRVLEEEGVFDLLRQTE